MTPRQRADRALDAAIAVAVFPLALTAWAYTYLGTLATLRCRAAFGPDIEAYGAALAATREARDA